MEGLRPEPAVMEGCQCGCRWVQPSHGFPGVANVSQLWASPDQLEPTRCVWLGWEESPAGGEGQSATCKDVSVHSDLETVEFFSWTPDSARFTPF